MPGAWHGICFASIAPTTRACHFSVVIQKVVSYLDCVVPAKAGIQRSYESLGFRRGNVLRARPERRGVLQRTCGTRHQESISCHAEYRSAFFAAGLANGSLKVKNSQGAELASDDYRVAPALALTFRYRF
jgi:hypothetical protein